MLLFDPLFFFSVIGLYAFIPGLLVGIGLLWDSKLNIFEKAVISLFIGLFLPPALSLFENMAGIDYSYNIAMINVALTAVIGILLIVYRLYRHGFGNIKTIFDNFLSEVHMLATGFSTAKSLSEFKNHIFKWSHLIVLTFLFAIMALTLVSRMATWGPIYFELDPYYYIFGGRQLLEFG